MYKFAFKNLMTRKSRTALAMVGLVIAIVGVISLMSISSGIRYEVLNIFSKMEGVTVMQSGAYDDTASYIALDNKQKLEAFPEVRVVVPMVSGVAMNFEGKSAQLTASPMGGMIGFMGLDPSEATKLTKGGLYNPDIVSGRMLKSSDEGNVIIGKKLAKDYKKTVGSKIRFNNREFKVVGIFSTGSDISDTFIAVDLKSAQEMTNRDSDTIGFFYIETINPNDADKLASKINFRYNTTGIKATSGSAFTSQISGFLGSLDAFFIGISSIALLVGIVGIFNTMLMSVRERTREFGILKAVGWTSADVIKLIAFESFFLGIMGGVVGIIFSYLIVSIAQMFISFTLLVTFEIIVFALVASILAGMIGGFYPAWKAAKLDPIQAIRFE